MSTTFTLTLASVTMTEAVERLREADVYVQFERERIEPAEVDQDRPIADSRRRFDVQLDLGAPVGRTLSRLTAADDHYDWRQLTSAPSSYFLWPRAADGDPFARSLLAYPVQVRAEGQPLADAVADVLARSPVEIPVFDRPGLLETVRAPAIEDGERPAYEVLGDLCAHSGKRIVWTLAGLGEARVLTIGALG